MVIHRWYKQGSSFLSSCIHGSEPGPRRMKGGLVCDAHRVRPRPPQPAKPPIKNISKEIKSVRLLKNIAIYGMAHEASRVT